MALRVFDGGCRLTGLQIWPEQVPQPLVGAGGGGGPVGIRRASDVVVGGFLCWLGFLKWLWYHVVLKKENLIP